MRQCCSPRPPFDKRRSTTGQRLQRGRLWQQRFFALTSGTGPDGRVARVPAPEFVDALNEQIANEYAASQQYVACAVHYDAETLPRLAGFFYRQSVEERNHAMMMIQYLLDAGVQVEVPGVAAPNTSFEDIVAPVALALEQER